MEQIWSSKSGHHKFFKFGPYWTISQYFSLYSSTDHIFYRYIGHHFCPGFRFKSFFETRHGWSDNICRYCSLKTPRDLLTHIKLCEIAVTGSNIKCYAKTIYTYPVGDYKHLFDYLAGQDDAAAWKGHSL